MTPLSKILSPGLRKLRGLIREEQTAAEKYQYAIEQGLLQVGRHSYGHPEVVSYRGDHNTVVIGSFCSMARNIRLVVGGNHRIDWVSTYPFRLMFDLPGALEDGHPTSKGDIKIGHDVWIGEGATIMSGVTVGNGAVIASRALVVKDVPAYTIVGGNPAKEIKRRFTESQIAALERISWWHWPQEKILSEVPQLCDADIDGFIRRHDREVE